MNVCTTMSDRNLEKISSMRAGGQILANLHNVLRSECREGISASALDKIAYTFILDSKAKPSFLGYQGYEYTTCISKNEEIVHGIPHSDKILFPGDICSIDVGVYYDGYHVDAARTHRIGDVDVQVSQLINVTQNSFFECIKDIKAGSKLGLLSYTMQSYIESHNLTVVKDLYSHGVGKKLHEDPLIPNYGPKSKGPTLTEGMTLAIEPMVTMGSDQIVTLNDKWTITTDDNSWASHYENTIYIKKDGVEILTI